jgi:transglutaminase-like putative cysteine protease
MAQLRITHETIYQYNRPVQLGSHRLVLRPREGHDLQVERMLLTISPAYTLEWSRDVFGNSVATVEFEGEAAELIIKSEVDILRGDLPRLAERSAVVVGYPLEYDDLETGMVAAYLGLIYPQDREPVAAWAKAALREAGADQTNAHAMVAALNLAAKNQITYNRREERGVQSPLETLTKRTGSCRDKATLLMEACRTLGIAARFASGYLDCPASLAGRASTHAWAEVYLAGRGWTGFDSTLGEQASRKHIPMGLSNHPRGVMPISGRFYGTSADYIGMKVAVKFEPLADSSEPAPAPAITPAPATALSF